MGTQVSTGKAVWPLLLAAVLGIAAYVLEGGDPAVVLAPVTGLVVYGVVYLLPWAPTQYAKAIASLAIPLVVMVVSGLKTGTWNVPEFILLAQGVAGSIATYQARRYYEVGGQAPNAEAR